MSATRVLLADSSPAVLQAVTRMLEPEFDVIGTVRDGPSLVGEAERLKPDVMIVDLLMRGLRDSRRSGGSRNAMSRPLSSSSLSIVIWQSQKRHGQSGPWVMF